jgi:DNA-binding transcriptional regulator YiaG
MGWTSAKIKALRARYGEKQEEFCLRLGVNMHTLRYWEQGRGTPLGSAQILLDRLEEDADKDQIRELSPA